MKDRVFDKIRNIHTLTLTHLGGSCCCLLPIFRPGRKNNKENRLGERRERKSTGEGSKGENGAEIPIFGEIGGDRGREPLGRVVNLNLRLFETLRNRKQADKGPIN